MSEFKKGDKAKIVDIYGILQDDNNSQEFNASNIEKVEESNPSDELLAEAEKIVRLKLSNVESENRSIQNKIDILQQKLKDNQDNIARLSNILSSL